MMTPFPRPNSLVTRPFHWVQAYLPTSSFSFRLFCQIMSVSITTIHHWTYLTVLIAFCLIIFSNAHAQRTVRITHRPPLRHSIDPQKHDALLRQLYDSFLPHRSTESQSEDHMHSHLQHHHITRHLRNQVRALRLSGQGHDPRARLFGSLSEGAYYIEAFFGHPQQMLTLNVDTGSSVLTVPSHLVKGIQDIPEIRYYDDSLSNTSARLKCDGAERLRVEKNHPASLDGLISSRKKCMVCAKEEKYRGNCAFEVSYGDGSFFSGIMVTDLIALMPSPTPPSMIRMSSKDSKSSKKHAKSPPPPPPPPPKPSASPSSTTTSFPSAADDEFTSYPLQTPVNVEFGMSLALSPLPEPPMDGMLGLAFTDMACSPNCADMLLDAMIQANVYQRDIFSVCLEAYGAGGSITFGELDPTIEANGLEVLWTQLVTPGNANPSRKSFYTFAMPGSFWVGNKKLINKDELQYGIADTGTTLLVVTDIIFDTIRNELVAHVIKKAESKKVVPNKIDLYNMLCPFCCIYGLTYDRLKLFPDIALDVTAYQAHKKDTPKGKDKKGKKKSNEKEKEEIFSLTLPPHVYMIGTKAVVTNANDPSFHVWHPEIDISRVSVDAEGNVGYCFGLDTMPGPQQGTNISSILGNTIMSSKYITIYDRENDRVGFADMKGGTCGTVDGFSYEQRSKNGVEQFVKEQRTYIYLGIAFVAVFILVFVILRIVKALFFTNRHDGYQKIQ